MKCKRQIPALLLMTSNAPGTAYISLLQNYQRTLSGIVGLRELLVSGDTLRLRDYSKTGLARANFAPRQKYSATRR